MFMVKFMKRGICSMCFLHWMIWNKILYCQ